MSLGEIPKETIIEYLREGIQELAINHLIDNLQVPEFRFDRKDVYILSDTFKFTGHRLDGWKLLHCGLNPDRDW